MAADLIPDSRPSGKADDTAPDGQRQAGQRTGKGAGRKRESLDLVEILDRLEKLAGLAALGLVKPAVANSIRGCYSEMLRALQQRDRDAHRTGVDDDVLAAIKRNPELGKLLQPFLTQEQIELLMADAAEARDGQA